MGKDRVIDKSVGPAEIVKALQSGSITIAQAQAMFNGVMPIGGYKGIAAIFDLDLLVKQPLVEAEQKHILGILDGRLEDYDKQTITIAAGDLQDSVAFEQLTVPTGEVWYVTVVETETPADDAGGARAAINWHCSLWTDPAATPSDYGQPFHLVPNSDAGGIGDTWDDEFHGPAIVFVAKNQPVMLRLPAGTVITFTATCLNAACTVDMVCTGKLFGFIGKSLVD